MCAYPFHHQSPPPHPQAPPSITPEYPSTRRGARQGSWYELAGILHANYPVGYWILMQQNILILESPVLHYNAVRKYKSGNYPTETIHFSLMVFLLINGNYDNFFNFACTQKGLNSCASSFLYMAPRHCKHWRERKTASPQNPLTHARAQQEHCEGCPSAAASQSKNDMDNAQPPCSDTPSSSFICWGERVLTCIILKACTAMQTLAFFKCPHCRVYVWETEDERGCGHVCTGCFLVVCVGVCVWECAQNPTQAHVHFFTRHCRLGVEV